MSRFTLAVILALFLPKLAPAAEVGLASVDDGKPTPFDGGNFHGRLATGAKFNPRTLTAAHRTLPFGTLVRVTNLLTGAWAYVKINDRGPCNTPHCRRIRPDLLRRIIDLTPEAADRLRLNGLGKVLVQVCKVERVLVPIRVCL